MSTAHLGLSDKLSAIAASIAEARELDTRSFDACLSSNRTCEVALQEITSRSYGSFALALERVTRR